MGEAPAETAVVPSTPTAGRTSRLPRSARLLAKIAVAATLCGIIIARIDWGTAWSSLKATGWGAVVAMVAIMISAIFISAYKWRLLLEIHDIQYSLGRLSRYYFVAIFFNNFLPTSIGGDSYRIYKTFDNGRSKASAVIAVAMERLTGFGGLVVLGVAAGLLLTADVGGNVTTLALAGTAACVVVPWAAWRFRSLVPKQLVAAVPEKFRSLYRTVIEHFDDYARQPVRSLAVIAVTLCFHIVVAFGYYVILRYGTHYSITLPQLLTALTASTLVAVLPVSINGIGVFEGTFIYLLAQYGVPADVSIVAMILNRGLLIALSIVGAGVYLLDSKPSASVAALTPAAAAAPSGAHDERRESRLQA